MRTKIEPTPMDNNVEKPRQNFDKHVTNILLAIITLLIGGMFNFLWDMNRDFGKMEERDSQKSEKIDALQITINRMQNDVMEMKDRMTRLEAHQDNTTVRYESTNPIRK